MGNTLFSKSSPSALRAHTFSWSMVIGVYFHGRNDSGVWGCELVTHLQIVTKLKGVKVNFYILCMTSWFLQEKL